MKGTYKPNPVCALYHLSSVTRRFPTRSYTNRTVQPQKMARGSNFKIRKEGECTIFICVVKPKALISCNVFAHIKACCLVMQCLYSPNVVLTLDGKTNARSISKTFYIYYAKMFYISLFLPYFKVMFLSEHAKPIL